MRNLLIILLACVVMAGCRTAPILELDNRPVVSVEGAVLSDAEIEEAIVRGAIDKGWRIVSRDPGVIAAEIDVREHYAAVRIPYDRNGYAIEYVDSRDLEQRGNEIHKSYNRWVQNLDQAIQRQLQLVKVEK